MGELINIFKKIKHPKVNGSAIKGENKLFQRANPVNCINCGKIHYNGGSVCSTKCFNIWNNKNKK